MDFWLRSSLASHFPFQSLNFPICKMVCVWGGGEMVKTPIEKFRREERAKLTFIPM